MTDHLFPPAYATMHERYDFGSLFEAFQGPVNVNPAAELAEVKAQSDTLIARLRSNHILLKAIERVVGEKRKRDEPEESESVDTKATEAVPKYIEVNTPAKKAKTTVDKYEPKVKSKIEPVISNPETAEDTADTASDDSSPERKESHGIHYKGLEYVGPTFANRPLYKLKQTWEWEIYPHGISRQSGKLRVQIKQKGVNPAYQSYPNTWQGLLEAAYFRDLEVKRLWEAGVLIRIPKFNFHHSFMKPPKSAKRRRGQASHRR